jgi:hypothetical protein
MRMDLIHFRRRPPFLFAVLYQEPLPERLHVARQSDVIMFYRLPD